MKAFKPKSKHGPEWYIQQAIIKMLRDKGWYVHSTHGSMFQSGFPDIFATHKDHGHRWVEVKLPEMRGSKFTVAQLEHFPQLNANGSGVWILTAATDHEYRKLMDPPNWAYYLLNK